jgi:hypothetical protein
VAESLVHDHPAGKHQAEAKSQWLLKQLPEADCGEADKEGEHLDDSQAEIQVPASEPGQILCGQRGIGVTDGWKLVIWGTQKAPRTLKVTPASLLWGRLLHSRCP